MLVRPSYVLSGAAMRVVTNDDDLDLFLKTAAVVAWVEMGGDWWGVSVQNLETHNCNPVIHDYCHMFCCCFRVFLDQNHPIPDKERTFHSQVVNFDSCWFINSSLIHEFDGTP